MKKKVSQRNDPTASPRSPRGLVVGLCASLLGLLFLGLMHAWMGTKTIDAPTVNDSLSDVAQLPPREDSEANFAHQEVHHKSPREVFLQNAMMAIQAEQEPEKRESMLAALVNQPAVTDIQSTLDELLRLGQSELVDDLSQRLLHRWAVSDGHAAAAWAEQLPAGPMRETALSEVAIDWANSSLSDAATWAHQLTSAPERAATMLAVANEAVRSDPVQALSLAAEMSANPQRDQLIRHAAMEWAVQDGDAAAKWARQITNPSLRDQVLADVATAWSDHDPISAAGLAVAEIPPGQAQSDAVVGIIERWAQQQPEQAADWVEKFPASELKPTAVANVATMWSLSDPDKAKQWQDRMLASQ